MKHDLSLAATVSKMECSRLFLKEVRIEAVMSLWIGFERAFLIGDGCAVRPGHWFPLHEYLALTACPRNPEFNDAPKTIFL